jgi:UrcA family protein
MKSRSFNQRAYVLSLAMLAGGGASISHQASAAEELQVVSKPTRERVQERYAGPLGLVTRTKRVSLSGLDMHAAEDIDVLHRRLANAARDVCDRRERHDALLRAGFHACVRLSLRNAMAEVDQLIAAGMERSLGEVVLVAH